MTNNALCMGTKTAPQSGKPKSLKKHILQDYNKSNCVGVFLVPSRKDLNLVLGSHS